MFWRYFTFLALVGAVAISFGGNSANAQSLFPNGNDTSAQLGFCGSTPRSNTWTPSVGSATATYIQGGRVRYANVGTIYYDPNWSTRRWMFIVSGVPLGANVTLTVNYVFTNTYYGTTSTVTRSASQILPTNYLQTAKNTLQCW